MFVVKGWKNNVEKKDIVHYEQFLFFQQSFQNTYTADRLKQGLVLERINPLLNDFFLDWTKSKTFAVNNLNVANILISVFDRVENIVGKGENAGYQHFLLFPHCFQRAPIRGFFKLGILWYRIKEQFNMHESIIVSKIDLVHLEE